MELIPNLDRTGYCKDLSFDLIEHPPAQQGDEARGVTGIGKVVTGEDQDELSAEKGGRHVVKARRHGCRIAGDAVQGHEDSIATAFILQKGSEPSNLLPVDRITPPLALDYQWAIEKMQAIPFMRVEKVEIHFLCLIGTYDVLILKTQSGDLAENASDQRLKSSALGCRGAFLPNRGEFGANPVPINRGQLAFPAWMLRAADAEAHRW
jgi:hypothetical protein